MLANKLLPKTATLKKMKIKIKMLVPNEKRKLVSTKEEK